MAECNAYLFVHFIGNQQTADEEQVYFSISKDGRAWKTLNDCKPVLRSTVGDKGIRDPHLVRTDSKFYILATDLSVYNRGLTNHPDCWQICRSQGSRDIVIWESEDLLHWSAPRCTRLALPESGCCWAPETIYDDKTDSYMICWASTTQETGYTDGKMYRSFTKDFKHFTEAELYITRDYRIIDTTFIKDKDVYYRISANNSNGEIIMEASTSLDNDTFEPVKNFTIDGIKASEYRGYEGPTGCKVNGEEQWCLMLDRVGDAPGYYSFITDDMKSGKFLSSEKCTFDINFRHGTIMPITLEEYDKLLEGYK